MALRIAMWMSIVFLADLLAWPIVCRHIQVKETHRPRKLTTLCVTDDAATQNLYLQSVIQTVAGLSHRSSFD